MKIKSLLFVCCLGLLSSSFADNRHVHPQKNNPNPKTNVQTAPKGNLAPGFCEIEIINNSFDDVRVSGVFDDGAPIDPFNIYSFEAPHYVDLFYSGYCHAGMTLYVDTFSGYRVYAGYTPTQSTVTIVPFLAKQPKIEVHAK
jgi:hypothetical protein